jgi:hypothetical protein
MYRALDVEKKETECNIPVKGCLLSRVSVLAYALANNTF